LSFGWFGSYPYLTPTRNIMGATRSLSLVFLLLSLAGCDRLATVAGPSELVSFGYVRASSCERRGPVSYNCVMKNFSDGPRGVNMECASFDMQGRVIGRSHSASGMTSVTFNPGEERIAAVYYEEGAATLVCADVQDSIPAYKVVRELVSAPSAKDIVSTLSL